MICFRDRTFCSSDCVNALCFRHFDDEDRAEAHRWWGSDEAPIAFTDFSSACDSYKPPVTKPQT